MIGANSVWLYSPDSVHLYPSSSSYEWETSKLTGTVMLDIPVLTSQPVHQVLNSASQSPWVSQAVGHATEIPRFHDLFDGTRHHCSQNERESLRPKYNLNPKIIMIRKMIQKHLERQPNTKLHATCCLSMPIPCHTSKWSVAPAPMASPIALPPPLPTTCLPEKQSQDGIVPS